jgi:hydrogenase maturation protease
MKRVIAIGSVYDNDDISWRCLQALESELLSHFPSMDIVYCDSPGTQLIHLLRPEIDTVLIDALLSREQAGKIIPVDASALYHSQVISSHEISVAHILQLAGNLKLLPERLSILGIAIDPAELLSQNHVHALAHKLKQLLM